MKNIVYLFVLCFAIITSIGCKKERNDPNTSDAKATAALQGKWRATQQSATVNGQPDGETTFFNGDEAIFEFSANELISYDGSNQTASLRRYSWKVVNGELILREQFAASAQVYKLTFDGNNSFNLLDSYTSQNDQITITIRFSRK
jgi:hypothetical protein